MSNIPEIFGCMVFNDAVMRQRLPKDVYKSLTYTIQTGTFFLCSSLFLLCLFSRLAGHTGSQHFRG